MDENIKVGKNFSVDGTKLLKCSTNTGTIVIPDFITEIGEEALFHLYKVKEVILPSSLKVIGTYAFARTASVNSISLPEGLEKIGILSFYYCAIYSITLPSSVRHVERQAFASCHNLHTINLNEGLKTIGNLAFEYTNIKSLRIPASVEEIGNGIVSGCTQLTHIEVDPNNKRYHSKDNCIIETATNRLVAMCKSSRIPDYVTTIAGEVLRSFSNEIFYLQFPNGVTTIEEEAFAVYKGKEIIIPGSVKFFGHQRFLDCQNLVFSNGIESLDLSTFGKGEIGQLHIPATVKEIKGEWSECKIGEVIIEPNNPYFHVESGCIVENATNTVVWGCGDTIPEGTKAIGLFNSTTDVLQVPNSVEKISQLLPGKEVVLSNSLRSISFLTQFPHPYYVTPVLKKMNIPASVTEIADNFFEKNELLEVTVDENNPRYKMVGKSIVDIVTKTVIYSKDDVLPDGIEHIGAGAYYSSPIRQLVLPPTIKSLGTRAFDNCTSLQSVQFSNVIPQMGEMVFKRCCSLKEVVLPETIQSIPRGMFAKCGDLKTINIPSSVLEIEAEAFCGTGLTEITIPNGVRAVKNKAFQECEKLATINLPSSIREFGEKVFEKCTELTEITIPYGVEALPEEMFCDCSNLTKVDIPETVTSIERSAFRNCKKLNVQLPPYLKCLGKEAIFRTATEQLFLPYTLEVLKKGALLLEFDDTIRVTMKIVKYSYNGTPETWDKIEKGFDSCFKQPVYIKK